MKLLTAKQAKKIDEYTINTLGVPSITLMERASSQIADAAMEIMENSTAAVFAGSGNNGGDGYGAAVELIRAGKTVRIFATAEAKTTDAIRMSQRASRLGVEPEPMEVMDDHEIEEYLSTCSVIIDAIYGVGYRPPLTGQAKRAAELINASGVKVVAADMPSGINTDTGEVDPDAVKADITVTFTHPKIGQLITPGTLNCGQVRPVDIGISVPDDVVFDACTVDSVTLPRRRRDAHKGNFGRILIIAGSTCYTGAPSFASHAAVRSGAGLVFLGVPESVYQIEAMKNDEAMVFPLPCDDNGRLSADALPQILEKLKTSTVCLVGPGLGVSDDTSKIVEGILQNSAVPVIVDADGINSLSQHIDILDRVSCPVILTPHDGEFARLGGDLSSHDRLTAARDFSKKHGITLVLKGYHTITALPDGSAYVNTTGGPGMAKGGSGDVLAGMIAAFTAQFEDRSFSVPAAVYLHGKAGDLCAERHGEYSMTPSDVIDAIKYVTR